jgi:hypothetical protein
LGSNTSDELLSVKRRLVKIENKQKQCDHVLDDSPFSEVVSCCLEVALKKVQQRCKKVYVILVALKPLHHLLYEYNNQF